MANVDVKKIIKDFSSYYGGGISEIKLIFDKVPHARIGKTEVQGLRNIVNQVSKPSDPESEVVQDEWVEYVLVHMGILESPVATQVLKDLNEYVIDKVYFVGNQLGPIDILIYYLLYNQVLKLTFQEKEKYLHFSRWFNNIQQNRKARQWRCLVPFSKSELY